MKYVKNTELVKPGIVVRDPETVVDADYVERFTSPATLAFFRELGGTERVTKSGNTIIVRSTSPDGTQSRLTTFAPIQEPE